MSAPIVDPDLQDALESDDMPTDILPMVWRGMKRIINDNSAMRRDIEKLEIRTKALEETSQSNDDSIETLQVTVKLLESKMIRSDIVQHSLMEQIDDLRSRSMRDNLIFNFDAKSATYNGKEADGENCAEIVRSFLREILGIQDRVYIQSAHRLGKMSVEHSRPIIARIPETSQRSLIFRNANRLKDTNHYISQQMTPSRAERRKFALPEFREAKQESRNNAVLAQDKLYIRNKLQVKYVKPNLPPRPLTSDAPSQITESKEKKDGGSVFHGYCAAAKDIKDVANVRQYLISNKHEVTTATHVIYAYRFESRGKVTHENFDSDGDHGMGFNLLEMMRKNAIVNTICIATRLCNPGFSHIGKKRFVHLQSCCLAAYNTLHK